MKSKFFYKINKKGEPVPGSNIRRFYKPIGKWVEIPKICCDPADVPCTCKHRYFIQVDGTGSPVSGTLIKRKKHPENGSDVRYIEVLWNHCCA